MPDAIPLLDVLSWDAEAVDIRAPGGRDGRTTTVHAADSGEDEEPNRPRDHRDYRSVGLLDILVPDGWEREARCAGRTDVDFYPRRGQSLDPAKVVCASCPVRHSCLLHALLLPERFGVWGGVSETARGRLLREARRRPRWSAVVVSQGRQRRRSPVCQGDVRQLR